MKNKATKNNSYLDKYKKDFLIKSNMIHNFKYDYSNIVDFRTFSYGNIICPIHGIFKQRLGHHKLGAGCPNCSFDNKKNNFSDFIKKFIIIHKNKYDYSITIYKNMKTKIKILCPIHGVFEQLPNNHLKGQGCKLCVQEIKKSNIINFINKSKLIHGDAFDYSKVEYKNSKNKVLIKCQKHGDFKQTPNSHLNGNGCPKCRESHGEKNIRIYLDKKHIHYEFQKKFKNCKNTLPMSFDFYLPDFNLCIEFDGIQHYKSRKIFGGDESLIKVKRNDLIKNDYCKNNNINLIRIPYFDIKNIEHILNEKLFTTNNLNIVDS